MGTFTPPVWKGNAEIVSLLAEFSASFQEAVRYEVRGTRENRLVPIPYLVPRTSYLCLRTNTVARLRISGFR